MDPFNRDNLHELATADSEPAVTIYMPTVRAGREVRQNAVRFKNLIKKTSTQLSESGMSNIELRRALAEAAHFETNEDWWQHQSDGLAMFISSNRFDRYRVPLRFDERVAVGRRFHVRPMIRLLQNDGRFYVLAVSQNAVRLLEGTHFGISELEPIGLPTDMKSALNIDEYVDSLQQHSIGEPVLWEARSFTDMAARILTSKRKTRFASISATSTQHCRRFLTTPPCRLYLQALNTSFRFFNRPATTKDWWKQPLAVTPITWTRNGFIDEPGK